VICAPNGLSVSAELEGFLKDGTLSRSTRFFRDQDTKVYVQHRMLDARPRAVELDRRWRPHLRVCDATRMARDVDAGVATHPGRHGRYQRGRAQLELRTFGATGGT